MNNQPKGVRLGGRKKGTPNKATAAKVAEIAASGLTPLDYLLSVMRDTRCSADERRAAATAAAPYVHPKLASVEMRAEMTHVIEQPVAEPVTLEEAERAYLAFAQAPPASATVN
jgi:hypothetical protein